MAHLVQSMASVREKPWHWSETGADGRSIILAETPTTEEMIEAARLGWTVEKVQLSHWIVDDTFPAGIYEEADGCFAIRRADTLEVLSSCGPRYEPIQNRELFAFAEDLINIGGNGDSPRWETAGALAGGRRVWTLLKLPKDFRVPGTDDLVQAYLCVSSSHDGSQSFTAAVTPIRVVCQNTLSFGLRQAHTTYSTRHTANVQARVAEAANALGMAEQYFTTLEAWAGNMAGRPMSVDAMNTFVHMAFPNPPSVQAAEKLITTQDFFAGKAEYDAEGRARELVSVRKWSDVEERPKRLRELTLKTFETSPTCAAEGVRGSAWGALNAAFEVEQYQEDLDTSRKGRKPSDEARFSRGLWDSTAWRTDLAKGLETLVA